MSTNTPPFITDEHDMAAQKRKDALRRFKQQSESIEDDLEKRKNDPSTSYNATEHTGSMLLYMGIILFYVAVNLLALFVRQDVVGGAGLMFGILMSAYVVGCVYALWKWASLGFYGLLAFYGFVLLMSLLVGSGNIRQVIMVIVASAMLVHLVSNDNSDYR